MAGTSVASVRRPACDPRSSPSRLRWDAEMPLRNAVCDGFQSTKGVSQAGGTRRRMRQTCGDPAAVPQHDRSSRVADATAEVDRLRGRRSQRSASRARNADVDRLDVDAGDLADACGEGARLRQLHLGRPGRLARPRRAIGDRRARTGCTWAAIASPTISLQRPNTPPTAAAPTLPRWRPPCSERTTPSRASLTERGSVAVTAVGQCARSGAACRRARRPRSG